MSSALTPMKELLSTFSSQQDSLRAELFEFLKYPSISSEPSYATDVRQCAGWVASFLKEAGMTVELWEGEEEKGHPTVFATWLNAGPDKPTVLIYNHYDVQPVDPLPLWTSPPFEPRIEGEEFFARGAMDNKGQCFFVIAAIRHLLKTTGKLPVNVKLCIEGEEETGSESLHHLVKTKAKELAADFLYIVDVGLHERAEPVLTLGVRGIATMTLELRGSSTDLHSGIVGGLAYNPNRALAEILGSLIDENGRVTVPGFYDDVLELSNEDREQLDFTFHEEEFRKMFGAEPVGGEHYYSPLERAWTRPTLEINGLGGGYSGTGFKTVIPAVATAKISCRLVPNQSPEKIGELVKSHLLSNLPNGITGSVTLHGLGQGIRSGPNSRAAMETAAAMSELMGKPCKYILSGGSIPIVADLAESSGAEVVLMGFGLPDDGLHAPNEHFGIDRVGLGFATIISILERLAVSE